MGGGTPNLGLDDNGIHALTSTGIASEGNGTGGEGLSKKVEGRIRSHEIIAGICKVGQPRRFGCDSNVMGDIDGHRLIDRETEEGGIRGGLITVGGLDICGALHAGGDGRKGKRAVDIHLTPDLEA